MKKISGMPMFSLKTLVMSLSLFAAFHAWAEAGPNGEALYQNHCTSCHQSEVYTRPDRKIGTYEALQRQVQRCELALNLRWFDEEIDAVTRYLNQHYYRFAP